jgi:LCP family protein required for cell wall assembly
MYSHLDDADQFMPTAQFRTAVHQRARRLRSGRRALSGFLVLLVVIGTGALYVARRNAAITRIDVTTTPSSDGATNVLLVGDEEGRADTLVVVRIDPAGAARTVAIPRDLWDPVANAGVSATYVTGAQALIDSVERTTHIPLDHYIAINFAGFEHVVDALGGLRIAVDQPMRDQLTGLDLPASACATLNGKVALSLVRSRHLEVQDANGVWQQDPTGDLGRINRAQALMTIELQELPRIGANPTAIDRITRVIADNATIDSGLDLEHLIGLARKFAAAAPSMSSDLLPVAAVAQPNGAAALELADGATSVLSAYGAPATTESTQTLPQLPVPSLAPIHPC